MSNIPVRLTNCSPEGAATRRVLQRGGRVWVFRDVDGSPLGDRICTLPGLKSDLVVLAPKGFGRPLLARSGASGWKGIPNGEPCVSERWSNSGGIAAWLHAAGAPFRPGPQLALGDHGVGPTVFAVWRTRGLSADGREMILRLLDGANAVIFPDASGDVEEMVVELAGAEPRLLMARIERAVLRTRLTMPTLRVGVAGSLVAARALTDTLEAGWVGLVPEHALGAWLAPLSDEFGMTLTDGKAHWKGPPIADVDGLVSLCRALSGMMIVGAPVRVGLQGERASEFFTIDGTARASDQLSSQVAASVCEHFFKVGAVRIVSLAPVVIGASDGFGEVPAL